MTDPNPAREFDTTLTSRYECKYLIDRNTAEAIRRYLPSYTTLDPFSARSEDHRYRVHSLYLDTPSLRLYGDTAQGVRNRYKLRLRYYEETGSGPIFFEVKKRADIIVRKNRESVSRSIAQRFLHDGECGLGDSPGDDLGEFYRRCHESGARPALRIRYWREAWESLSVDPVRITFDTEVEHCILSSRGLQEQRPAWRRTEFDEEIILEVKFTDLRPLWLNQMLQIFQLSKLSVAKYAESVEAIQRRGEQKVLECRIDAATRPRRMDSNG